MINNIPFKVVINNTTTDEIRTCCRKHWEEDAGRKAGAMDLGNGSFALINPFGMPFMVCKTCGCKRCPKATDCSLECTGSNEPGQEGSIYG